MLVAKANEDKAKQVQEAKQLEQEVEQSVVAVAEASGSQGSINSRPRSKPITAYFSKSGAQVKYRRDSDLQRRFDLEVAIYIATSNLAFNHIDSSPFTR